MKIALCSLIICAATLFSFSPSLRNGFVNYDDDRYVYRNPMIRDYSSRGIGKIFSATDYTVLYTPLVFLSYAVEYHYCDLNPLPYHATNLLLHLCNCLLVLWLVILLDQGVSVACIAALLFGVHPLRVESVAWITERKDLLYTLFFLGAVVCYRYYLKQRSWQLFGAITALFALSLLSKPVAAILPCVLLLCDYLDNGHITLHDLREKAILFCIAAAFIIFSMINARHYLQSDSGLTTADYLFVACYAVLFYLFKSFLPLNLSCLYPHPVKTGALLPPAFLASPLVLLTLALLVAFSTRYTRKILFGSLFFLITLAPALRLYPSGLIIVADRYTYLPSVGLAFIAAALLGKCMKRKAGYLPAAAMAAALCSVALLMNATRERCRVWSSNIVLWDDAVRKSADDYIPVAYFNRGIVYTDMRDYRRAVADFSRALTLYQNKMGISVPRADAYDVVTAQQGNYGAAYQALAQRFAEIGKTAEAMGCLNAARNSGLLEPRPLR